MKRLWLLFAQTVTVLMAAYFVVLTLKPQWLSSGAARALAGQPQVSQRGTVPVLEAPPAAVGVAPVPGQNNLRSAAQRASPAVVSINTTAKRTPKRGGAKGNPPDAPSEDDPWFRFFFGDGDPNAPQEGLGSGVIVSPDGYVLTNNHVIEGADEIEVVLSDTRRVKAKVLGTDPETDLALLKIELGNLPAIVFGNSDQLQVGDQVLAIGNPFGVGQTVTGGIVSALGRNQLGINTFENFIQTDAAINPGNSGGALVDSAGHLLGINTAIYSRSGGSNGIGFAIPASSARQVMEALIRDGVVTRGWVGVEPQELTPELIEAFDVKPVGGKAVEGVILTGVLQGGPAAQAGVKPGDVVTAVGERRVRNVPELLAAVASLRPGEASAFAIVRKGSVEQLSIKPGTRPKQNRRR